MSEPRATVPRWLLIALIASVSLASGVAPLRAVLAYRWTPYWSAPLTSEVIVVGRVRSASEFTPSDSLLELVRKQFAIDEPSWLLMQPMMRTYTDYTVVVSEVWNGHMRAGDTLSIRQPGGSHLWVEDVPYLDRQRDMVLFLSRDDRLIMQGRWSVVTLEACVVSHGRVDTGEAAGVRLGTFRWLVEDALARGTHPWALPRDSVPVGSGRLTGRCGLDEDRDHEVRFLRIRKARVVAVPHAFDGHFVLPPLPAGRYRMDLILRDGEETHVPIRVREGAMDSLVITLRGHEAEARVVPPGRALTHP